MVAAASPPPPSSLYSHAVQVDGWLHVAGQLPTDPDAPTAPLPEGIEAQSEMCFENIRRILDHAGYTLKDTVFMRIFLRELDRDFTAFNSVYSRFFLQNEPLPSRTTVGVSALSRGALVEIDIVCFR